MLTISAIGIAAQENHELVPPGPIDDEHHGNGQCRRSWPYEGRRGLGDVQWLTHTRDADQITLTEGRDAKGLQDERAGDRRHALEPIEHVDFQHVGSGNMKHRNTIAGQAQRTA